jgi:HK97 family phage prohead protease
MIKFDAVPITLDAAAGDPTTPRTITGIAVPWDVVANASGTEVMFKRGAFNLNAKAARLLENHDGRPIGMVTELVDLDNGLGFSASFAKSRQADDVVELIQMSAYDSVSVGAVPKKFKYDKNGVMVVSSADLIELSVVTNAAFPDAKIEKIAASEPDPEEVDEDANEPHPDTNPQEETMSQETPETVEATASVPTALFYSAPRSPIKTNADYLHHSVQAALNPNSDSRLYVAAADEAKAKFIQAADDSFTTNPAFNPVAYERNVVQVNIGSRPVIDACGGTRAIPASGMTISIPKITTNGTVATTAEGAAPSETGIVSAYVNGTVVKLAGLQRWSVELQERSDPSFAQIMLDNMTRSYRKATEVATIAAITAGGTQASTTAASAAGIQSFVSTESAAAYLATGDVVSAYTAGVSQWSLMQNAVDGSNRPLFNAGQPQNSSGSAEATTLFGNVLGVPLYVSSNMVSTTIDESAFLIVPSAIEIFESSQLQLSVNVPVSGEIEAMIYGYFCPIVTIAGGLRRFNLT